MMLSLFSGELDPDMVRIIDAVDGKQWLLVLALLLTFIISRLRAAGWLEQQRKRIPWLAFGIGTLGGMSARIAEALTVGQSWTVALVHGFVEGAMVGFASMGWYSLTFKKVEADESGRQVPPVAPQ